MFGACRTKHFIRRGKPKNATLAFPSTKFKEIDMFCSNETREIYSIASSQCIVMNGRNDLEYNNVFIKSVSKIGNRSQNLILFQKCEFNSNVQFTLSQHSQLRAICLLTLKHVIVINWSMKPKFKSNKIINNYLFL